MADWTQALESFMNRAGMKYKPSYVAEVKSKLGILQRWAEEQGIGIGQFTELTMDRYIVERAKTVNKSTQKADVLTARIFFRFCHQQRFIERNPLERYAAPSAPDAFVPMPNTEYLARLLQAITDKWDLQKNRDRVKNATVRQRRFFRTRDYALIAGLIETGCRVGEMCQLRLADFDAVGRSISFRETKGGEPRTVPVSAEWVALVQEWLKIRPETPDCDTLFMTSCGSPMSPHVVKNQWKTYEDFAQLPHFTRHSVRHYALTQIARVSILTAARVAGHKDPKVTMQRYLHNDPDQTRADHAAANPLGRVLAGREITVPLKRKRGKPII